MAVAQILLDCPSERRFLRFAMCRLGHLVCRALADEQRLGASTDVACAVGDALDEIACHSPDLVVLSDHLSPTQRLPHTACALRAAGAAAPLLAAHCFERGLSDKQIADQFGVAISTVKTHAQGIHAKLDADPTPRRYTSAHQRAI